MAGRRPNAEEIGLPFRAFLFTVDQIATMLNVTEDTILKEYLFFEGISVGRRPRDRMVARNIAPEGSKKEWRVAERELVRWFKQTGFHVYDRAWPLR